MSSWNFGPESVGAIATSAATLVALWASWQAIRAPGRARLAERLEATREVLSATEEALALRTSFAKFVEAGEFPDDDLLEIRTDAKNLGLTLERLVDRPFLTDGAIATGVGAATIMAAIADAETVRERMERIVETGGLATAKTNNMIELRAIVVATRVIVEVVTCRAVRVRDYHHL